VNVPLIPVKDPWMPPFKFPDSKPETSKSIILTAEVRSNKKFRKIEKRKLYTSGQKLDGSQNLEKCIISLTKNYGAREGRGEKNKKVTLRQ